jgi:hypothetical protein
MTILLIENQEIILRDIANIMKLYSSTVGTHQYRILKN